jgi:DNA primase
VVLLYDGDRAGYKATMHALQLCVEADTEVRVAKRPGHGRSGGAGMLDNGVDPDSLIAGGGAELLREAVDRAQGGIEFFAFEVWAKARGNADARARALEDAVRLVAKIASPTKRDLIVGTLATGLEVDVSVVRNALARGPGQPQAHRPAPYGGSHPNAPSLQREDPRDGTGGPAEKPLPPPPMEELELITLLADHPVLIATVEADKAFWLLTDDRLRAMYSAARTGQSLLELAPVRLPSNTAQHVLSGKYASKDPTSSLAAMTRNLEARKVAVGRMEMTKSLADAKRRGDHDLARQLTAENIAERTGNHELATQLADERKARSRVEQRLEDPETSNRKQVE